jgi:hypothetical protein
VIGRVLKRSKSVRQLLYYLYGPGKACEHVNPHLVGGWRHPETLEPPMRADGRRDFRRLAGLLEVPLVLLGDRAPGLPVWHVTVWGAPEDPVLGDGNWGPSPPSSCTVPACRSTGTSMRTFHGLRSTTGTTTSTSSPSWVA